MHTHARGFVFALILIAAWALLLTAPPAFAQMGAGGYAGPPAGLSPGPVGGGYPWIGASPYLNLPRPVLRPTLAYPPWPLHTPMGEGGSVFGDLTSPFTGNMRLPYAGLALRDTGAGVNWTPVYDYSSAWPGLPPSLAWPWWQYSPASGWAPSTCYSRLYVNGRWISVANW